MAGEGSRASLDDLYARYHAPVHARCCAMLGNRDDADDAVHEVFRRFVEHAGEMEQPLAWLLRVAANVCFDELRRRRRERRALDREGSRIDTSSRDVGDAVAEPVVLDRILGRLSPGERAVVVHRWRRGTTLEEAAGDLGIASSTARNLLMRARNKVGAELQRYCAGLGSRVAVPLAHVRIRLRSLFADLHVRRGGGHAGIAWLAAMAVPAIVAGLLSGGSQDRPGTHRAPVVMPHGAVLAVVQRAAAPPSPAPVAVRRVVVARQPATVVHSGSTAPSAPRGPRTMGPVGVPSPPNKVKLQLIGLSNLSGLLKTVVD